MGTDNKAYATKLLDRLRELDYQTVEAYYDMGSIISSIQHGKLHSILGYKTTSEMIEEELTYTPSTGLKYAKMYRRFRELKYLKHEAIELLSKFGLTHMCDVLPGFANKIGQRAIRTRIDAIDEHQINFTVTGAELEDTRRALIALGAKQSEDGRWHNSSEAFIGMVDRINANGNAPKLKVVAK